MVNLVSFSFGIVVIAFVVTCVMILFLVILSQMRKTGRSFSSMSYFIIALFGGLLLLCNIIFGGLFCLGMYSFIQDLKLIDNNLATDVTVIIIGYVF